MNNLGVVYMDMYSECECSVYVYIGPVNTYMYTWCIWICIVNLVHVGILDL